MDDDPRLGTFLGDLAEELPQRVRAVRNQRVVLDIRGAHEPVYVFRLLLVDYQIIEAKDIILIANSAAIFGVYKLDHGELLCCENLNCYFRPTIWRRIASCSASDFSWTNRRISSASVPTAPRLGAGICSASSITRLAAEAESSPLSCIPLSGVARYRRFFRTTRVARRSCPRRSA